MSRGFEVVEDWARKATSKVITEEMPRKIEDGKFVGEVTLPTRGDTRSAGYDFYLNEDLRLLPAQKTLVWTDVKAYMQEDEVLHIYPRSSLGIKNGMMLSNTVGVIDASYYGNEGNDGNIGLSLLNTSGKTIILKKGDRVAQGVFSKYLIADNDNAQSDKRVGGIGSTGR